MFYIFAILRITTHNLDYEDNYAPHFNAILYNTKDYNIVTTKVAM
jgi:hypothetical protein